MEPRPVKAKAKLNPYTHRCTLAKFSGKPVNFAECDECGATWQLKFVEGKPRGWMRKPFIGQFNKKFKPVFDNEDS